MFQIDSMSRKPVYEQIIEQVESFLLNDVLRAGDQIPSVRNVTMQHAINPRTVLKAYNDLDARGLIRSVPGKGYFVCEEAKQILNQRHMERLQELKKILEEMALAGVPLKLVQSCVQEAYKPKKEEKS
ncbi:MAG: GntR family transcriptional regulator [Oscillospiraceae bacterium]|nr:GntR family transcriptional regulator [Oscillospiraceae bacterium]